MMTSISVALLLTFTTGQPTEGVSQPSSTPTIIYERDRERSSAACVTSVESGSTVIVGQPQEDIRAAYRSWQQACDEWKAELRRLNARSLMIASCESPQRREEKFQLQNLIRFESKSLYKIKVGCD